MNLKWRRSKNTGNLFLKSGKRGGCDLHKDGPARLLMVGGGLGEDPEITLSRCLEQNHRPWLPHQSRTPADVKNARRAPRFIHARPLTPINFSQLSTFTVCVDGPLGWPGARTRRRALFFLLCDRFISKREDLANSHPRKSDPCSTAIPVPIPITMRQSMPLYRRTARFL